MDNEEYESIADNDYRNLPEYRRFIPKKEKPESTEFGKNYHLIRAKPAEQLCLENTVYRRKMRVAGILFGAGILLIVVGGFGLSILKKLGLSMGETAEYIKSFVVIVSSILQVTGALKFVGTINSPITIKDVQRYREAIRENWEKEQQRDA